MTYSKGLYSYWQYKSAIVTDLYSLVDGPGVWRGVVDVYREQTHGRPILASFVLHRKFTSPAEAEAFCVRWLEAAHDRSEPRKPYQYT